MDLKSTAALQSKAYDVLTKYFSDYEDEVLNIEILPPAFPPPDGICMQEDFNLGLPKEILALAFLEARRRFLANIQDGLLSIPKLQATNLLLLSDPEYLTAANFRKRRLQHLQRLAPPLTATSSPSLSSDTPYIRALTHELIFVTSILTSPLHRQTKSPTLWHHRFWLVKHHLLSTLSECAVHDFLRSEVSVVCKSGERHPKNYYAFGYARRLFALCLGRLMSSGTRSATNVHLVEVLDAMRNWCCRHPSDISGFSFLTWLLRSCEALDVRKQVVGRIVDYALSLRVGNESLWVFVRTMVADGTMGPARADLLRQLTKWLEERGGKGGDEESIVKERARQAVDWIEKYGESLAPLTM